MANSFIGRIKVMLGLDSGQFEKGVSKSKKELSGFQKFSKSWAGKMTGIFAGAFAISSLKDFGVEAVRLSGQMQGVKSAFQGLNDPTLLNKLREATKGTVSDLELMKNAVKAKNLGVPIEKLGTLFEFARRRAKEPGESVQFLTESIVTGIGRKSVLIMDNLGISASALAAEFKKTGDFGLASANIVESELKKMGADLDTTAEATARVSASWENYMTVLGGQSTGIINTVSKSLNNLLNSITETDQATAAAGKLGFGRTAFSELDSVTQGFVEFNAQMVLNAAQFAENETNVNRLKKAMAFFKEESKKVNQGTDEGRVKMISYAEAMAILDKRIKNLNGANAIPELTDAEKKLALEARNASLNIDSLKDSVKGLDTRGGTEAISEMSDKINEEFNQTKPLTLHVPATLDLAITDTSIGEEVITGEMIRLGERASEELTNALQGTANLMIDTLGEAFSGADWNSIASSFLSGFADILMQFGKMMLTLGLGLEAFKTSLASLNPAVAIAGGVALMAVAGGIKTMLKNSAKSGSPGSGGGSGSEQFIQSYSGGQNRESGENLRFVLEGKNLVAATNRYANSNRLTT